MATYGLNVRVVHNDVTEKDEIHYSNGTGNLTVRGTGGVSNIEFSLVLSRGWRFDSTHPITFNTIEGPSVDPFTGRDVFTITNADNDTIELNDNLDEQDVGTVSRYKYTLKLVRDEPEPSILVDDPEIQNEREPRLGGG